MCQSINMYGSTLFDVFMQDSSGKRKKVVCAIQHLGIAILTHKHRVQWGARAGGLWIGVPLFWAIYLLLSRVGKRFISCNDRYFLSSTFRSHSPVPFPQELIMNFSYATLNIRRATDKFVIFQVRSRANPPSGKSVAEGTLSRAPHARVCA